jgi:hypothetical protein
LPPPCSLSLRRRSLLSPHTRLDAASYLLLLRPVLGLLLVLLGVPCAVLYAERALRLLRIIVGGVGHEVTEFPEFEVAIAIVAITNLINPGAKVKRSL